MEKESQATLGSFESTALGTNQAAGTFDEALELPAERACVWRRAERSSDFAAGPKLRPSSNTISGQGFLQSPSAKT